MNRQKDLTCHGGVPMLAAKQVTKVDPLVKDGEKITAVSKHKR